ncbi:30S ribosomal protein S8 [Candidatus Saccharibacteria bacterium]|nr:30S ribosomal protein S8 [Candidatus Saccharibacteria bacterium]
MVSTDPISDMFTRIRNAIMVNKAEIILPHSNVKETVAKILVDSGFLMSLSVQVDNHRKSLQISINPEGSNASITEIARLSTPGRRLYVKSDKIPVVKRGRGIVIVSTSQGVMTGTDAMTKRLGGELIAKVY